MQDLSSKHFGRSGFLACMHMPYAPRAAALCHWVHTCVLHIRITRMFWGQRATKCLKVFLTVWGGWAKHLTVVQDLLGERAKHLKTVCLNALGPGGQPFKIFFTCCWPMGQQTKSSKICLGLSVQRFESLAVGSALPSSRCSIYGTRCPRTVPVCFFLRFRSILLYIVKKYPHIHGRSPPQKTLKSVLGARATHLKQI